MTFFTPAPRPRGRGWSRRCRYAAGWLFLAAAVGGGFGLGAAGSYDERQQSIRLATRGQKSSCVVVSKRSTTGKSASYYVTLRRTPSGATFERGVSSSDWRRVHPGTVMFYYTDPGTGRGMAQIERGKREDLWPVVLCSGIALVCMIVGAAGLRKALREMRLMVNGIEVVATGGGFQYRVAVGSRAADFRTPPRTDTLIRTGPAGQEVVVLAAADLSCVMFPHLQDVEVVRLVYDELTVPLLPAPVRTHNPAWRAWMRHRCRGFPILMGVATVLGALVALIVAGKEGITAAFWLTAAGTAFVDGLLLLGWLRRHWCEHVLWREGEEVHAVVLDRSWENGATLYTLGFSYRGSERTRRIRIPDAFDALVVGSPGGSPAVTTRVAVLVDPARPERWSVVPTTCVR